eukprot:343436_1
MSAVFSGTTGTAAAQLEAETINTLSGLGLNVSNFDDSNIPASSITTIKKKLNGVELLVIDEATFNNELLFGGLSVLLIGDMYQFPPVDEYLTKPALYQALVRLGL